jgi:hypothetical protein
MLDDQRKDEMAHMRLCFDRTVGEVEKLANGIQRRVFHEQEHHGGGKDRQQDSIVEVVRKVASSGWTRS